MIKGILKRIREEYGYLAKKEWSFDELSKFWNNLCEYEDKNEQAYSYFRRFTDGFRLSNIKDSSYILDICSRSGYGTLFFHQHGKVKKAVCADVSQRLLNIAASRLRKEGVNFELLKLESFKLPFKDSEFDAILCFETIEHMSKPNVFLKELSRVIESGGEIVITTPNLLWEPLHWLAAILDMHHSEGPHRFLGRSKIRSFILEAGFKIKREATSVLLPFNNKFSIKLNEWLEKRFKNSLLPLFGLRRIFICEKT